MLATLLLIGALQFLSAERKLAMASIAQHLAAPLPGVLRTGVSSDYAYGCGDTALGATGPRESRRSSTGRRVKLETRKAEKGAEKTERAAILEKAARGQEKEHAEPDDDSAEPCWTRKVSSVSQLPKLVVKQRRLLRVRRSLRVVTILSQFVSSPIAERTLP